MATTGMWAVKNRLDHLVNYVSNPYKTIGLETVIGAGYFHPVHPTWKSIPAFASDRRLPA